MLLDRYGYLLKTIIQQKYLTVLNIANHNQSWKTKVKKFLHKYLLSMDQVFFIPDNFNENLNILFIFCLIKYNFIFKGN